MSTWKRKCEDLLELQNEMNPEVFAAQKEALLAQYPNAWAYFKSMEGQQGRSSSSTDIEVSAERLATNPGQPPLRQATSFGGFSSVGVDIQPGMVFNDYRLVEEIGRGGMGVVFRARRMNSENGHLHDEVAIKIILPLFANDAGYRRRFRREAELKNVLDEFPHPHVVKLFGLIVDEKQKDRLGLKMEYIDGVELTSLIPENGMTANEAFRYLKPIASGLQHLHDHKVFHRDMKPENIRLRQNGEPVILDLGIAKSSWQSAMTKTGMTPGTQAYMAPEQLDNQFHGPQSDQYALGLLAYKLMTGRLPWNASDSEHRVSKKKYDGELIPLSEQLNGTVALSRVVMRMLCVDPTERYPSCLAMISDFETALQTDFAAQAGAKPSFPSTVHAPKPPLPSTTSPLKQESVERIETDLDSNDISIRWGTLVLFALMMGAGVAALLYFADRSSPLLKGEQPESVTVQSPPQRKTSTEAAKKKEDVPNIRRSPSIKPLPGAKSKTKRRRSKSRSIPSDDSVDMQSVSPSLPAQEPQVVPTTPTFDLIIKTRDFDVDPFYTCFDSAGKWLVEGSIFGSSKSVVLEKGGWCRLSIFEDSALETVFSKKLTLGAFGSKTNWACRQIGRSPEIPDPGIEDKSADAPDSIGSTNPVLVMPRIACTRG